MVYLQNTGAVQSVFFPRYGEDNGEQMSLRLRNNVKTKVSFFAEVYEHNPYGDYFNVIVTLPVDEERIVDGEYNYELIQSEQVVSSGLLVIGEVQGVGTQSNAEIKVKQYGGK